MSELPALGPEPGGELVRTLHEVAGLGVLLFDVTAGTLVFRSREAAAMFASAGIDPSFAPLAELLLGPGTAAAEPQSVKLGARLIGFTVYEAGEMRLVFCRDVSERTRASSIGGALEQMSDLDHIFSAMRHEIGNPLNSVKTALAVLRSGYDRFSRGAVLDYLDRVLAEISRMEQLLAALKSFSMQEPVRCESVSVAALLARFEEGAREEAAERGAALEVSAPDGCFVEADPPALRRILRGVLANALNALAGRSFARVSVRAAGREALVEIRISDNGRGMNPAEMRELFLPLAAHRTGHLGMGLVIARKLLAEMGGTIEVESTEGTGTTVLITLRRAEKPGTTEKTERTESAP